MGMPGETKGIKQPGIFAAMKGALPTRAGVGAFFGGGLVETAEMFGAAIKGGTFGRSIKDYFSGKWYGTAEITKRTARLGLTGRAAWDYGERLYRSKANPAFAPARSYARYGGAIGLGLGIATGVSMLGGPSVFDQAQAVGGGIIGGRWAHRLMGGGATGGLGKFGIGAAAVGAGLGGQYMDWKQWGAASAGYWGARGLQRLGGRQGGAFLGGFKGGGGGLGRAAGIGLGLGAEYLISNVL